MLKRLAACLFGGVILALMVGKQEGTINADFGIATREALWDPRIFVFLAIGFVIFLLVTFWPLTAPYLFRPGIRPLGIGLLVIVIAQTVMNWYDPIASGQKNGRFNTLRPIVDQTAALNGLTDHVLRLAGLVAGRRGAGRLQRRDRHPVAGGGIPDRRDRRLRRRISRTTRTARSSTSAAGPDHALGPYADVVGFLILAGAGITAVHSRSDKAETREFLERTLNWRPGLAMGVLGLILGLFSFLNDCWYAPLTSNSDLSATHDLFDGTGISSLASKYLNWLGWTLFIVALVLCLVGTFLVNKLIAWLAIAAGLAGVVATFFTLHSITFFAYGAAPGDGQTWGNLGAGGFVACIAFALFAAGALQVVLDGSKSVKAKDWAKELPVTAMVLKIRRSARLKSVVVAGAAIVLFYPPVLTVTWQNVLVTQIGVYVLLAIGLNVVVGWAGLLDLGYIAFYGIGSYTTAYFTGSLPGDVRVAGAGERGRRRWQELGG